MADPNNNSGNNNNSQQQTFTFNGGGASSNGTVYLIPGVKTYTFTVGDIGGGWVCEEAPKKKKSDGCVCKKCKELFPYAEPNQEDGTLICYGCRMVW